MEDKVATDATDTEEAVMAAATITAVDKPADEATAQAAANKVAAYKRDPAPSRHPPERTNCSGSANNVTTKSTAAAIGPVTMLSAPAAADSPPAPTAGSRAALTTTGPTADPGAPGPTADPTTAQNASRPGGTVRLRWRSTQLNRLADIESRERTA